MKWDEWFYYDETSPTLLRWKVDRWCGRTYKVRVVSVGDVAGGLGSGYSDDVGSQYHIVMVNNVSYRIHNIIFEMFSGGVVPKGFCIDHIDGNTTNNTLTNLRVVTHEVNCRNFRKSSANSSGVTGVSLDQKLPGKFYWKAKWIDLEGRQTSKSFSVAKLGSDSAFRMACEYRSLMINLLNSQGAGYLESHGKRDYHINKKEAHVKSY